MSFICPECWGNQTYNCPGDRELHFQSRGRCEMCGQIATCSDCPTSHVEPQMRAANPEAFRIIDEYKGRGR